MTNTFFGDSITDPTGCIALLGVGGAYYPWIWGSHRGGLVTVKAIGGSTAADQADAIVSAVPPADSRQFMLLGTNDVIGRGGAAAAIDVYAKSIEAEITWLAGACVTARDPAWTFTGTWANNPNVGYLGAVDRYTLDTTATAAIDFSGDKLRLGYTLYDWATTAVSDVYVDGVLKASVTSKPAVPIASWVLGRQWAPSVCLLSGLGSGSHHLEIRNHAGTLLDWICTEAADVQVNLIAVPPFADATKNAASIAYTAALAAIASRAQADGFDVTLHCPSINRTWGLCADGIHPSGLGHHVIAATLCGVA